MFGYPLRGGAIIRLPHADCPLPLQIPGLHPRPTHPMLVVSEPPPPKHAGPSVGLALS